MSVFKRRGTSVDRSRSGESASPDRRDPGRPAALSHPEPSMPRSGATPGASAIPIEGATLSVASVRWQRFKEVVLKLSRFFLFLVDLLPTSRPAGRGGPSAPALGG